MPVKRGVPREKRPVRRGGEHGEDDLAAALDLCGPPLSTYVRQHLYAPPRKLRADFAWLEQRVLVEIQGGVWAATSGHAGGAAIINDNKRLNAATLAGYRLLRFTPRDTNEESIAETLDQIERVLRA